MEEKDAPVGFLIARMDRKEGKTMAYQPTQLNGETVFRNEVFQTGLMSQLLDGVYDGEMTIGELLSHGNFGVGTF